jgi:CheY-like chemotaxis protein
LLVAAEKASHRAADLVRKLLGFSRRSMLRLEALNLNAAVEETLEIFCRTIDPQITVDTRPAADLWSVHADHGQVNQVIMNLCLNARDAMPKGGRLIVETANVHVGEAQAQEHLGAAPGQYACLRIRDTGHGMNAETRSRIFEPFFTTKGPGKGLGLGLAMVFGIIDQHHGWIECDSAVGMGTCFAVYLPRHDAPAGAGAVAAPRQVQPRHGQETILFVEDESAVRNIGKTILQRFGYRVLVAEDGVQALEVYRREGHRVDLVILDLTMPRLSGRDTLRELVNIDPAVRVVFSSGYSAEAPVPADERNVLGFIGKPYRPDELATVVRGVLDRGRRARQRGREQI